MDAYEIAAHAEAKKQGLTADQVRALGYPQVAALAGVKIGEKGDSPPDFFYRVVRHAVATALAASEQAAVETELTGSLANIIKTLSPEAQKLAEQLKLGNKPVTGTIVGKEVG